MKTIIHVNQHVIKANGRDDRTDPPITVKTGKANVYTSHVDIVDAEGNVVASVVYRPAKPLPCGAKVWITTELSVKFCGEKTTPACMAKNRRKQAT